MPVNELLQGADSRPRVHVWPDGESDWAYSIGPVGRRVATGDCIGEACKRGVFQALESNPKAKGFVIIVEERESPPIFSEEIQL